jgi:ATP-dependent DNA helicase RecG
MKNPGGLPSGLKPEAFGRKSVARNPLIASLLHRINFIEKVGTGISRIRDAVRKNGKSTVEFSYNEFFTVTYYRSRKAPDARLKASEKTSQKSSQKGSQKIIEYMNNTPEITIHDLAERLGIIDRAVKKQISILKANVVITRIGLDKGGYWSVVKKDNTYEP